MRRPGEAAGGGDAGRPRPRPPRGPPSLPARAAPFPPTAGGHPEAAEPSGAMWWPLLWLLPAGAARGEDAALSGNRGTLGPPRVRCGPGPKGKAGPGSLVPRSRRGGSCCDSTRVCSQPRHTRARAARPGLPGSPFTLVTGRGGARPKPRRAGRPRLEDREFAPSAGDLARPCLKKITFFLNKGLRL